MKNQLPDFVIAALYKNTLVITDDDAGKPSQIQEQVTKKATAEAEEIPQAEQKKWYMGDNRKNITILVNHDDAVFINDDSLNLLGNVLAACKLNLGDVAIINYHRNKFTFTQLKETLKPRYVFLFGLTSQQIKLPFAMPYFQVQQYNDCTFLIGPSMADMIGDSRESKVEKSKLWVSLKKVFDI